MFAGRSVEAISYDRYLRKAAGCSQHSSSLGIAVRNVSLSRKIEGLVGKVSIEPILRRSFMH